MDAITLLTIQAVVVLIAPVIWGWYVRKRTGASWKVWGWGALTFFVSQIVLRIPLLGVATILLAQLDLGWTEEQSFWFNLAFLTLTASLFEEGGRWLMMRWRTRNIVQWKDGVMFGAGHGGIEAMLLVGLGAINGVIALSLGDLAFAEVPPEQMELAQAQINQLRSLTWDMVAMGIWERVIAIIFHTAASLLVLKAVRERNSLWWWAAFVLHTLLNGIALIVLEYSGALQTEIALTIFSVIPIAIIWWTYRQRETDRPQPETPELT
jgi:uncharacterized membrane protein YhfC